MIAFRLYFALAAFIFVGCAEQRSPVETLVSLRDVSGKYMVVYFTSDGSHSGTMEIVRESKTLTGTLNLESVKYDLGGIAYSDTSYVLSCFNGFWGYNLSLKHKDTRELFGSIELMRQVNSSHQSFGVYSCLAIRE